MCIDAKTSLNTFIIGTISSCILWKLDKQYHSILIFSVSMVQLAEYLMWIDIECKTGLNKLGNIIILLSLFCQLNHPLLMYTKNISYINICTIFVYLFYLIYYINNGMKCSIEGYKGHLEWGLFIGNNKFMYLMIVWYLIASSGIFNRKLFYNKKYNLIIEKNFFALIFLLYALKSAGFQIYDVKKWGSFWCYISNSVGPILILLAILEKKNLYKPIKL